MGILRIISSSSAGNCYALTDNHEHTLLIECGVSKKDVLCGLNYEIGNVDGCIISHKHGDHINIGCARWLSGCGIALFGNETTKEVLEVNKIVSVALTAGKRAKIGNYYVQPFALQHEVENYGYIIQNADIGKVVFATDCSEFPYKIKNVNHWLIEANNDPEIVIDMELSGEKEERHRFGDHLSLQQAVDAVRANLCPDTRTITMIHLSDTNSDERKFIDTMRENTGIPYICCADKGMEIELKRIAF